MTCGSATTNVTVAHSCTAAMTGLEGPCLSGSCCRRRLAESALGHLMSFLLQSAARRPIDFFAGPLRAKPSMLGLKRLLVAPARPAAKLVAVS